MISLVHTYGNDSPKRERGKFRALVAEKPVRTSVLLQPSLCGPSLSCAVVVLVLAGFVCVRPCTDAFAVRFVLAPAHGQQMRTRALQRTGPALSCGFTSHVLLRPPPSPGDTEPCALSLQLALIGCLISVGYRHIASSSSTMLPPPSRDFNAAVRGSCNYSIGGAGSADGDGDGGGGQTRNDASNMEVEPKYASDGPPVLDELLVANMATPPRAVRGCPVMWCLRDAEVVTVRRVFGTRFAIHSYCDPQPFVPIRSLGMSLSLFPSWQATRRPVVPPQRAVSWYRAPPPDAALAAAVPSICQMEHAGRHGSLVELALPCGGDATLPAISSHGSSVHGGSGGSGGCAAAAAITRSSDRNGGNIAPAIATIGCVRGNGVSGGGLASAAPSGVSVEGPCHSRLGTNGSLESTPIGLPPEYPYTDDESD